jgi:hypothetical protein
MIAAGAIKIRFKIKASEPLLVRSVHILKKDIATKTIEKIESIKKLINFLSE